MALCRTPAAVAVVLLLTACHPVKQEVGGGTLPVDPLQPGGQYLTYDPEAAYLHSLVEVFDPQHRQASGKAIFYRDWLTVSDGVTSAAGPDYDQSTCSACHVETARRADFDAGAVTPLIARPVTAAGRQRYGQQINVRRHGSGAPEATVLVDYVHKTFTYPDGETRVLEMPVGRAVGNNGNAIPVGLRAAPLLFGWGLLERVDPTMIAHFDDAGDRNGDGISGRIVHVDRDGTNMDTNVAILGWKNSHSSLRAQIAAALANDMGVISRQRCESNCNTEIEPQELDALTDYVRFLGVPDRRPAATERGQDLFGLSGCSDCHVSVLITTDSGASELSRQLIWPYSDLMLHDMGPDLAEPGDAPDAREWRTAPLWGLGVVERHLPQRGFLHDGRARSIEEAILWHGGEARPAQQYFATLNKEDRDALLDFVRSL